MHKPQQIPGGIAVPGVAHLDLGETLLCGQAFRWRETAPGRYRGVVRGRAVEVAMDSGTLLLHGADAQDFDTLWRPYFDLDTDYGELKARFSQCEALEPAVRYAPGIRILRQESWEALVCFIISQNNNVGRITGIVDRLCRLCGRQVGEDDFAFPSPEALATCTEEELKAIGTGYRHGYLIDAARRVTGGDIDLSRIPSLPLEEARELLCRIKGVGTKVADCALLYGFYRTEVCPMDVWMKRVMARLFPEGMPEEILPVAGIAQQYLFHYARTCPGALDTGRAAATV